ncbi:MAG: OmpA family protein [Bacteroidota bacterium]
MNLVLSRTLLAFLLSSCAVIAYAQIEDNGLPAYENIQVYPLDQLNSAYRDVNISVTPDGKYLYFMSGRGGAVWSAKDKVTFRGKTEYDGDIWYSEKKDTTWQAPRYLPATINTSRGEDEPNISPDGQTVYFQSWNSAWMQTGGPYYRAELYGKRWQNPRGLYGGISRFFRDSILYHEVYATDGMAISPDGRIFIVAAGVNYDGNLDLYISRKNERGDWSYPERLPISTLQDERSIFIAGDNRSIYFGSSGHGGAGGLDIFKATLHADNSCTDIINIGAPFNTEQDDYGFIIDALGHDAYFVRNSDIYYAKLGAAAAAIKPQPTVLINGIVRDCDGREQQSSVELYNLENNQLIAKSRSNSITGAYAFSVPFVKGNYIQRFKLFSDQSIIKKTFSLEADTPNRLFFEVSPSCPEEIIAAPSIPTTEKKQFIPPLDTTIFVYFDFDEDVLKASEQAKIDTILALLLPQRNYFTQIVGHTDAKGTDEYNILLSERRANRVNDYIQAIRPLEHSLAFRGESVPVLDNNTPANRAKNRRVRVRIADALE